MLDYTLFRLVLIVLAPPRPLNARIFPLQVLTPYHSTQCTMAFEVMR